jgi:predicted outer membrane repeat protein
MKKIILALFILFIALIGISGVSAHDVSANDVKDNPELSKVIGSIDAIEDISGQDLPEDDILYSFYMDVTFTNNTAETGGVIYLSNDNSSANNSNIEDIPTIDENRIVASVKMNENNSQVVNYGNKILYFDVNATIVDEQGNPCANQEVLFVISSGIFYYRLTDENGVAQLHNRVAPGEHKTITSIYNGIDVPNKITITG